MRILLTCGNSWAILSGHWLPTWIYWFVGNSGSFVHLPPNMDKLERHYQSLVWNAWPQILLAIHNWPHNCPVHCVKCIRITQTSVHTSDTFSAHIPCLWCALLKIPIKLLYTIALHYLVYKYVQSCFFNFDESVPPQCFHCVPFLLFSSSTYVNYTA